MGTDLWSLLPFWPAPMVLPPLTTLMLVLWDTPVLLDMLVLDMLVALSEPQLHPLPQLLRTVLNTELLDREPSRLESNRLLLDMLMPLLDNHPSPSLPLLMSLDPSRTLSTPLPFPLQSSLLPQHLMLPSPLHLSQLAPPLLTPWSRPRLLPQSELTPESLPS